MLKTYFITTKARSSEDQNQKNKKQDYDSVPQFDKILNFM